MNVFILRKRGISGHTVQNGGPRKFSLPYPNKFLSVVTGSQEARTAPEESKFQKEGIGSMSLILNIFLWILQVMLAALMLFHGGLFVTMTPAREQRMMERRPGTKPQTLAPAFRLFIGVAELFAAIGLLLPGITHILPWLTPLAATALLVVMIGAVIYHQQRGEGSMVRRPPHLTLHAVGGFKLAKVLAILITVFYTDKQMAKVRRKTACLS